MRKKGLTQHWLSASSWVLISLHSLEPVHLCKGLILQWPLADTLLCRQEWSQAYLKWSSAVFPVSRETWFAMLLLTNPPEEAASLGSGVWGLEPKVALNPAARVSAPPLLRHQTLARLLCFFFTQFSYLQRVMTIPASEHWVRIK